MRLLLVLAACLPLAGCSQQPIGTVSAAPTSGPTPTASATQPPSAEVDMCSLVPLGDVQAKSPFQTPLARFEPGVTPVMCEYASAEDAEEPVSVLLVATTFTNPADARTSLANYRQAALDSGLPFDDIEGLGESAFSSGSDRVGVHAVVGATVIDANMGGEWPDTTDDAKVAAGVELVRMIINRLP